MGAIYQSHPPTKPKPTSTPAASSSTPAPAVAAAVQPPVAAEVVAAPTAAPTTESTTVPPTVDSVAAAPAPAFSNMSSFLSGAALEQAISNLTELGYPRDQVLRALRASYNNPDRAAEYLINVCIYFKIRSQH
jgi:UV excision repair protein RAD23